MSDDEAPWTERDSEQESIDDAAERYTAEHGPPECTF